MAGIETESPTDTLDMDASVDRIGAAVFGPSDSEPTETTETPTETPQPDAKATAPAETTPNTPTEYEVPKSWKQDMHPYWATLDPKVKAYYIEREKQMLDGLEQYKQDAQYAKPLREVLTPYQQMLQQINLTPQQAIDSLFKAHMRLTQGSVEQRKQAYQELGKHLQLLEDQAQATGTPVDPVVKNLEEKLSMLEQQMTARQQAELDVARTAASKEVETFASDTKAHPYFDEVATDIAAFVGQGKTLPEAYEMAVWANPVTRQKEIARVQTEHEAKLKENARLSSLPKKKAASVNVNGSASDRTPTEPMGTMEETIRDTHRQIRSRAS